MGKVTTVAGVLFAASAVFGSLFVDNSVPDRAAVDDEAGLPAQGGDAGDPQAEQGGAGNGGSGSGGLAGARGEERGKAKGLENAGSGERGSDR